VLNQDKKYIFKNLLSPRSDITGIKYQEETDIDLDLINENIKINY